MKNFKVSDSDIRMFNMIFDIPLHPAHPRYKLQKQFFELKEEFPTLSVETSDFYNDGGYASVHFDNDEFVVLCNMDEMTMDFDILIDYEQITFQTIETVPFSWESLKLRLKDMLAISPWTETFIDSETAQEARSKAVKCLKDKWN